MIIESNNNECLGEYDREITIAVDACAEKEFLPNTLWHQIRKRPSTTSNTKYLPLQL